MRYDREEKRLAHFSSSADPSTVAAQTQRARGESTSIRPVPGGAPLKDKTTTIRLRFPASCRPFSWGYVHLGKKKSPTTLPHLCSRAISPSGGVRELAYYPHKSAITPFKKTAQGCERNAGLEGHRMRLNISNMAVIFVRMTAQSIQPSESELQAANAGRPRVPASSGEKGLATSEAIFPLGGTAL